MEVESDSEHFQFLTYHYIEKLGLFTEEEFLSEPRLGLLSSSKSKFRDKNRDFWSSRTLGKSSPNLPGTRKPALQKISSRSSFQLLKLVRSKSFVFPFEVKMSHHTKLDENIEGADNF